MAKPEAMLKHLSIVQLACAAVHAFTGECSAGWEAMEQHEANFLQQALDGKSSHMKHSVESSLLQHVLDGESSHMKHSVESSLLQHVLDGDSPTETQC